MNTSTFFSLRIAAILAALLIAPSAPAADASDLSAMSLEDLMKVEVSSVSRRDRTLSQTPAAAFVITQDDIRRSGSTSIPELLRMVPGVQVARISASQWAVSVRGFNSRVSNKLLVLIDGRSVYNNVYSGVFWDQNDVMLEDVERIEVIRGPGATMWGANAVNGVINVITKKAKDTQGGLIATGAGQSDRASSALRYGGHHGDNLQYRAYSKYLDRSNMQNANGSPADDAWNTVRGGGRLDWQATGRDSVTIHGDVYRGSGKQDLASTYGSEAPGTFVPDPISFSGGYVLGRWERSLSHGDFALQTYYNRESRVEAIGAGTLHTVDFDFQHRIVAGARNDLMWGGGYRLMEDNLDAGHTPFRKRSHRDNLVSAFLNDDLTLVRGRLILTLGSKVEHNSYTGLEVEPGLRLLWTPTGAQSAWASVARAVRMPSVQDLDLQVYLPGPAVGPLPILSLWEGNPQFRSEILTAYETGYRRQVSNRLGVDVTAFVNRYSDLQAVEQITPYVAALPSPTLMVPFIYGNSARGTSWGMETSITWNPARSWRLAVSYSWLNGRFRYYNPKGVPTDNWGNPAANFNLEAPRNTMDIRSGWNFKRHWSLDTAVYYAAHLTDPNIPGYVTANARVARRIGESGEISAGADNLLSPRHIEFIPSDYVGYSEIRRSAYVKMTWRF